MHRAVLYTAILALALVSSASAYHYGYGYYDYPTNTRTLAYNDGYGTYYQYDREYADGYSRYATYHPTRGVCVGSGCKYGGYGGYYSGDHGAYYDRVSHYEGGHYCWSYPHSCGTKYNRWYW